MESDGARSMALLIAREPRMAPGAAAPAGAALTGFGSWLLSAAGSTGNTVVSPYSVYTVLAMAAIGARARTAEQLDALLGAGQRRQAEEPATPAGQLAAVDNAVAAALTRGAASTRDPRYNDVRPMELHVATALFAAAGLRVRLDFVTALATGFGTGMFQLDYAADPEGARGAINSWVSDRTDGRISALLGRGMIPGETVLTLVGALQLTAPWRTAFRRESTESAFSTIDGSTVGVRYLRASSWYERAAGEGWSSVTVAYRGGGLAMTIVLPDPGVFDDVRRGWPEVFAAVQRASGDPSAGGVVDLRLPGFAVDTRLSLVDELRGQGVTDLFDPAAADLSGIAGEPGDLVAAELVHRTIVTVDENGTEASAATAMTMLATGAPQQPATVIIDRSFLFAVHDTVTGAPLFLGQVIDPTTPPAGQPR